jgi:hypothetical protein
MDSYLLPSLTMSSMENATSKYSFLENLLIKERNQAIADLAEAENKLEEAAFEIHQLDELLLIEKNKYGLANANLAAEKAERSLERRHAQAQLVHAQKVAKRKSEQLQSADFIIAKQEAEIARLTALYESAMVELIAAPRQ